MAMQLAPSPPREGRLYLWGAGMFGLMGGCAGADAPEEADVWQPSLVSKLQSVEHVALSTCHALATGQGGLVYSWGDNENGQLGHGDREMRSIPTRIAALDTQTVKQVSAGYTHSSVLASSGAVFSFGGGEEGQLGCNVWSNKPRRDTTFDTSDHKRPVMVKELARLHVRVIQIACGEYHTLCLSSCGAVYAWGDGSRGQLGFSDSSGIVTKERSNVVVPQHVNGLDPIPIVNIAAGQQHSLAVSSLGSVYSWGHGSRGQTGHGSTWEPKRIDHLKRQFIVRAAAGRSFSAFVADDGELLMCGANERGQLGLGHCTECAFPVCVTAFKNMGVAIWAVACGTSHTIAVSTDNQVFAWGSSSAGQLGVGTSMHPSRLLSSVPSSSLSCSYSTPSSSSTPTSSSSSPLGRASSHSSSTSSNRHDSANLEMELHTRPSTPTTSPASPLADLSSTDPIPASLSTPLPTDHVMDPGQQDTEVRHRPSKGCGVEATEGLDGDESAHGLSDQYRPVRVLLPDCAASRYILDVSAGSDSSAIVIAHTRAPSKHTIGHKVPEDIFALPRFQSLADKAVSSGEWRSVLSYITTTLSQPTLLNASFMLGTSSGIAAAHVEHVYKQILKQALNHPQVGQALAAALQTAASRLIRRMAKGTILLQDPAGYRCISLILQSPHLSHATGRERMVIVDVAAAVARLPSAARTQLQRWWSTFPAELFGARLVDTMRKTVTETLLQQARAQGPRLDTIGDEVMHAVKMLRLLHGANNMTDPPLIAGPGFYLDPDAMKLVNWEIDYVRWNSAPPTKAQLPPFSFCHFPYLLDPFTKSRILRLEHTYQKQENMYTAVSQAAVPYTVLKVRRSHLVQDTLYQLSSLSVPQLRRELRVVFAGEEGEDQGGLTNEFFQLVVRGLMDPTMRLFQYDPEQRTLWYQRDPADEYTLNLYYLAGVLLGLAVFHGVSVHVHFPLVFYRKLLGQAGTMEDFKQADPRLAKSLEQIAQYEGDIEDLGLLFQVSLPAPSKTGEGKSGKGDRRGEGELEAVVGSGQDSGVLTFDLIPQGGEVAVTRKNKALFVQEYIKFWESQVGPQSTHFARGFQHVCNGQALKLFTAQELELLVRGTPHLSFKELQNTTRYEGYTASSTTVTHFWDIVHNTLTTEQKKQLLCFFSGSARAPLGGLGELRLIIQRASGDSESVPTSSTCFNVLLLPDYNNRAKLLKKLTLALFHAEGFGLR